MGSPRHIRRKVLAWAVAATVCAVAGTGAAEAGERHRKSTGAGGPSPAAGPAVPSGSRADRGLRPHSAGTAVPAAFAPLRPSLREPPALEDGALRREVGIFGSVPIPVMQIGMTARWNAILAGDPIASFDACMSDESRCVFDLQKRSRAMAAAGLRSAVADGEARRTLIRAVNRSVNATIRYQTDAAVWGSEDYWASPQETMARGAGDCEDYALLKLAMLAALGVPETEMTVVVVKDLSRSIGHAILAVKAGEGYDVLDNLTDAVRRDAEIDTYVPLYSIGHAGAWIHGKRRAAPLLQASSQPRSPAMPMEPGRLRGSLN
ncbi:MAG: transglutaminase-like cysteine peptidase [Burkholderiales bacterium]|jgi:predicted transglutaminase-like cysteine proteinase|nr:transglutaminase-like cysteine peptidase [Burkholderiales bacterium]